MATKGQKRKDKDRIVLKAGESQRPNGTHDYRWTGKDGKHHAVYAKTLEELREKEAQIENDAFSGLKAEARCVTINEMFDLWCQVKRGLKNNTFENYKYMYNLFVRPNFGKKRIYDLKKTDVKRFCNHLVDVNSGRTEHPNHAGDLPPLLEASGKAYMTVLTGRFHVKEVIGRTVILHGDPDDFHTQPSGNAGIKLACGVICRTG